jgi:hypothetical protein
MKNLIGAAVLLPLVSSLIVIILSIGNFYFVGKPYAMYRNTNMCSENYWKSFENVFPEECATSKIVCTNGCSFVHTAKFEISD